MKYFKTSIYNFKVYTDRGVLFFQYITPKDGYLAINDSQENLIKSLRQHPEIKEISVTEYEEQYVKKKNNSPRFSVWREELQAPGPVPQTSSQTTQRQAQYLQYPSTQPLRAQEQSQSNQAKNARVQENDNVVRPKTKRIKVNQ
jgi:hypothetical protein